MLLVLLGAAMASAAPQSALDQVRNRCLTGELRWLSSGETYKVEVPDSSLFSVEGRLERDGSLYLDFRTRDPDGGPNARVPALRGREQFQAILEHFDRRIKRVMGYWVAEGDNLETFNRLTAPPLSLPPAEAALQTWTGRQASSAGFGRPRFEELTGTPGRYIIVQVAFER